MTCIYFFLVNNNHVTNWRLCKRSQCNLIKHRWCAFDFFTAKNMKAYYCAASRPYLKLRFIFVFKDLNISTYSSEKLIDTMYKYIQRIHMYSTKYLLCAYSCQKCFKVELFLKIIIWVFVIFMSVFFISTLRVSLKLYA